MKGLNTTVGFEPVLKRLNDFAEALPKVPAFPPYNIRKIDENKYAIEMAVAGFSKTDLEIEIRDGSLIVKGQHNAMVDGDSYLFKGIADRAFTRQFALADTVEVKNADLANGILKIFLERFVPDEKKPKKVEIDDNASSSHPD
jgi:molecular chaperone IbpA